MTIITSNFIVNGTISNFPALYANTMTAPSLSNIRVESDLDIDGTVHTTKRLDVGSTIFATFRLSSNISFPGTNEYISTSNTFPMDMTSTDMSAMNSVPMVIQAYEVFNQETGVITVPTSGIYNLHMQGNFSNSIPNAVNGVYYKFLKESHSNARTAAVISQGNIVSTSTTKFLLAGDTFLPTFYSSDSNATLLADNGESYVGFSVMATVTPTHSNYVRV